MNEVWVDVKGYEGLYQISNFGRIKSFQKKRSKSTYYMKPHKNKIGYLRIELSKNGEQRKFSIHRLVAEHFIPNPYELPIINHKDEDKTNNYYLNLEWCTYQYNNTYNDRAKKASKSRRKKVIQYNEDGVEVNVWESLTEASKQTGILASSICECCNGKQRKTRNGHTWKYLE